ncbi:MAG: hypothetical protein L6R38_001249 [Xanthoria sp. 2 TBL-2021]|nr:MAG: hypothetical protein L6R38_001249 [Xanthoria sp. 2 TBL-2021]
MSIYQDSLTTESFGLYGGCAHGIPIRLLELLPDERCKPIRCRIHYTNLIQYTTTGNQSREPFLKYEALSYCWGDSSIRKSIFLKDTISVDVTANLHSALEHIRDISSSKLLWVDSICINQSDAQEKNQQVAIMQHIYTCADTVLIWSGQADPDSRAAFILAQDVLQAEASMSPSDLLGAIRGMREPERLGLPPASSPLWYDLFALIQRPWFKRAWVVQELATASQAIVMCGNDRLSWDDFHSVFDYLLASGLTSRAPFAFNNFMTLCHARRLEKLKTPQKTLHVLVRHRQALASDSRDKIFAFRGLIHPHLNETHRAMSPDYISSDQRIYIDFAIETIRNDHSLDILSVSRVRPVHDHPTPLSLPSWVPDWSVSDQVSSLQAWEDYSDSEGVIRTRFAAAGSTVCDPVYDEDRSRIGLQGVIVDRISLVGPECSFVSDHDKFSQFTDSAFSLPDQKVLRRWEDLAYRRNPGKYPTGEGRKDVYWQTLMAGTIYENFETTRNMFLLWDQSMAFPRLLHFVGLDYIWFMYIVQYLMAKICSLAFFLSCKNAAKDLGTHRPKTLWPSLQSPMLHRRIFTTKTGLLGLGPKLMGQDGDLITLFKGGALPLIVRPKGHNDDGTEEYELIGDCYIHGIMEGELYESFKGKFKTMWLV